MVDLVWTEVTGAKTAPNGPEIGVAHIFVPGQYMTKIENLTRAEFGSLKAYNYKLDKKNPFLQVRTGKANNSISNKIVNWVNQNINSILIGKLWLMNT